MQCKHETTKKRRWNALHRCPPSMHSFRNLFGECAAGIGLAHSATVATMRSAKKKTRPDRFEEGLKHLHYIENKDYSRAHDIGRAERTGCAGATRSSTTEPWFRA